ncbi:UNVERIFIED_CONTAM: hypothetical protein GTU68_028179 [Idotea baltica]|nr:hypothetical protein [Idotea baltica]
MLNSITVITIFPELFSTFISTSLISKAISNNILNINCIDLKKFGIGKHNQIDDIPYGGGGGMLLKPEPLEAAILIAKSNNPNAKVIYLTPAGDSFTQKMATNISKIEEVIFICGRYEGIDQRIRDLYVDLEISIGDYVLMGGEIPAMAIIEASIRLIPKVLGNEDSIINESFSDGSTLEAPHYTRPQIFKDIEVPKVLLSGNHSKIKEWRENNSKKKK